MHSGAMSIERRCSGSTNPDGAPATMTRLRESRAWRDLRGAHVRTNHHIVVRRPWRAERPDADDVVEQGIEPRDRARRIVEDFTVAVIRRDDYRRVAQDTLEAASAIEHDGERAIDAMERGQRAGWSRFMTAEIVQRSGTRPSGLDQFEERRRLQMLTIEPQQEVADERGRPFASDHPEVVAVVRDLSAWRLKPRRPFDAMLGGIAPGDDRTGGGGRD